MSHPKGWRQMVAPLGLPPVFMLVQINAVLELLDECESGMVNCLCGCAWQSRISYEDLARLSRAWNPARSTRQHQPQI